MKARGTGRPGVLGSIALTLLLSTGPAAAGPTPTKTEAPAAAASARLPTFIRVEGEKVEDPGGLKVAHVALRNRTTGRRVVLEGVVHIGEKVYYQRLQKRLATYDHVLFEAVRPADFVGPMTPPPEGSQLSVVAYLSRSLGLSRQLESLDYTRSNFVWADLSQEEFAKLAGLSGVSELGLLGAVVTSALKNSLFTTTPTDTKADLASAQIGEDILSLGMAQNLGEREMKWFLARQLMNAHGLSTEVLDPQLRNALEDAREKRALEVMERTFKEKPRSRVAILYGAGHMPSLQDRLMSSGYVIDEVGWDQVWRY